MTVLKSKTFNSVPNAPTKKCVHQYIEITARYKGRDRLRGKDGHGIGLLSKWLLSK